MTYGELIIEILFRHIYDPVVLLQLRDGLNTHLHTHLMPKPRIPSWYHLDILKQVYCAWRTFVRQAHRPRVNSWKRRLHHEDDPVLPFLS